MKLENLKPGVSLVGVGATLIATVIAVVPIGVALERAIYGDLSQLFPISRTGTTLRR